MKKVFTLLMAVTMVIGFAGIAAADCFNCNVAGAGNIARGCEGAQNSCDPFDFENPSDYCTTVKNPDSNRAVFKICDCITDGDFTTVVTGDTIDISLEILVNGEKGNNGVYWAEDVTTAGIGLGLYNTPEKACDSTTPTPITFAGIYKYLDANDDAGTPNTSVTIPDVSTGDCVVADNEQVVKIGLDTELTGAAPHGYVIQPGDEFAGNASWVIDIPEMRADTSIANAGDKVWVRIYLSLNSTGLCSEDTSCYCDIYIGELCCSYDTTAESGLIYPYFPPANSAAFNLLGMTITNLGANDGSATITMWETDGDVGTLDVDVDANGIYLVTIANLAAELTQTAGAGDLGDAKSYLTVTTNFPATGFAMIADTIDGASMGYLPLQAWEVAGPSYLR